jgi:peroxiredoxin (alkyl hydroperoxide reductase subunit C)
MEQFCKSLVSQLAPDFKCKAIENGKIYDFRLYDCKAKFKILIFYPLDFTFVCPTELHGFNEIIDEFKKRDASLFAISVDSVFSHEAWLNQPKKDGGISGISFPLLSDINKDISRSYGVLNEKEGIAFRALFIIDEENSVQVMNVNNLSIGRNTNEVLRLIDAISITKNNQEVCPVNWNIGDKTLKPDKNSLKEYLKNQ